MTVQLSALVNPTTTSGTPVAVLDEGVQKTAGVASLDFVGTGVAVTNTGDDVVIAINPPVKITVGTVAPGSPAVGDLWVDTN